MELTVRDSRDVFVPPGAYRRLEADLAAQRAELAEMPVVVLSCFDPGTRLLPFVLYDKLIFPAGARVIAAAVHQAGRVAPFEGVEEIQVVGGRLFFPSAKEIDPRRADVSIARFQPETRAGLRVEARYRQDDATGVTNLAIGDLDGPIERPVYLPGYVAWEHAIGHHDPLTDIFAVLDVTLVAKGGVVVADSR